MNQKILVTGATGHIGNVLVRKLVEEGSDVRALVLPGDSLRPLEGLEVETIPGNVLDPQGMRPAFNGVDTVYHLAGLVSILPGKQPHVRRVNVEGTRNILRLASEAGVRRLVYTSSIHAFKRIPAGAAMDETLPFDPDNPYGAYDRSKAEATLEVIQAAQKGLDAVIACPTGVIGPYDYAESEMGRLISNVLRKKFHWYVDGAYDFVDVRDVATGLLQVAQKGRTGEAYILGGEQITVRRLLDAVQSVLHGELSNAPKKRFLRVPFAMAQAAAQFAVPFYTWLKTRPLFTPYSLDVLRSNSTISHAKAAWELEYYTRPIFETLRDTVRWLLSHQSHTPA